MKCLAGKIRWWARQDSNLEPDGYEPSALTIELRAHAVLLIPDVRRADSLNDDFVSGILSPPGKR
ncbi:protein of unknown function [Hyphomicrobium sp. MC1]|nr:protein of unknown function [Hyphomicrobium sp. MC1]